MPEANAQTRGVGTIARSAPSRPSSGRGEATRIRLLDAAARLIAERGWGEVTTRLVAERAGVNQALVHYHFGSMDRLLREAAISRIGPELSAAVDPIAADGSLGDALAHSVAGLERFQPASETSTLMAEVLLRSTRDPELADLMGDVLRSFRAALARRLGDGATRGEVRDDIPPDVLATIVGAALDGLLLQQLAEPVARPDDLAVGLYRLVAKKE